MRDLPSILILILIMSASTALAQQLAFPTAEGYGRFATGGRGGIVCHVNALTGTSGGQIAGSVHHSGSFLYCAGLAGARTIVFDISGNVSINAFTDILNGNVTIAGQTAPGDGVALRDGQLRARESAHYIMRHLRVRYGNHADAPSSVGNIETFQAQDVIWDHCSVAWAPDDNMASGGNGDRRITYQWIINAEGTTKVEGVRLKSLGMLVSSTEMTIHHSLFANIEQRLPLLQGRDTGPLAEYQIVNNVIYNGTSYSYNQPLNQPISVEFVGNYYRCKTAGCTFPRISNLGAEPTASSSQIYFEGNIHENWRPTDTGSEFPALFVIQSNGGIPSFAGRLDLSPLIFTDAFAAYDDVLANAGAGAVGSGPGRDATDTRIINDVINRSGDFITLFSDVPGGYPAIATSGQTRAAGYDSDHDGIPDAWETTCSSTIDTASINHTGLSNSDEEDGALIVSTTGYSALEHYLNELAGDYALGTCGGLLAQGDTTDPTIAITAPTSSPTHATSTDPITTLAGTAGDDTGVTAVTWANTTTAGFGSATGCAGETSCTWSIASIDLAEGVNVIEVTAHDAATNTGVDTITVTLDTTGPTGVAITAPTEGAPLTGTYPITANAADTPAGMDHVEFYEGANLLCDDTIGPEPWTCDWDTTLETDGAYSLTVKAYDLLSNFTISAAVGVTVNNTPITFPPPATGLGTTHTGTITVPSAVATGLGTTHTGTITLPATATGLGTPHTGTITFPPPATGLGTP